MTYILHGKMSNDDDKSSSHSKSSTSLDLEKVDSENNIVEDLYKNPTFKTIEVVTSVEKSLKEGDKIQSFPTGESILLEKPDGESKVKIPHENPEKLPEQNGIDKKIKKSTKFKGFRINPRIFSRPFVGILRLGKKKKSDTVNSNFSSRTSTYSTDVGVEASQSQMDDHENRRQVRTVFSSIGGSSTDLTGDSNDTSHDNIISKKSSKSNSDKQSQSSTKSEIIVSSSLNSSSLSSGNQSPSSVSVPSTTTGSNSSRRTNEKNPRLKYGSASYDGLLLGGGRKEEKALKDEAKKALESSGSGVGKTSAASGQSKAKGKEKDKGKESDASKSKAGGGASKSTAGGEDSKASKVGGGKKPAGGGKKAAGGSPATDMKVQTFSTQGFEEEETPANEFKKGGGGGAAGQNDDDLFPKSGKPKGWRHRALCKLGVLYDRGCPMERPHPKSEKEKEEPEEVDNQPVAMGGTGKSESIFGKMKSSLSSLSSKISGSMSKLSNASFNKSKSKAGGGSGGASSTAGSYTFDDGQFDSGAGSGGIGHYKLASYQDPSGGLMGGGSASQMGSSFGAQSGGGSLFSPSTGSQGAITNGPGDPGEAKVDQKPAPPPRSHKYPSAMEEYCFGGLPPGVPETPKPIEIPTDGAPEKKGILAGMKSSLSSMGSNLSQSMSKLKSSVSQSVSNMKSKSAAGGGSGAGSSGSYIFSTTAFITAGPGHGLAGGGASDSTLSSSSGSALGSGSSVKSGADSGIFGKLGKETSGSGSGMGMGKPQGGSAEQIAALEKRMAEKSAAPPKQDGGWIKDEDYCPIPYAATFSQPHRRRWRKPKFLECPEPKPDKKTADGKTADYFPAGEQKKSGLMGSISQSLSSMSKSISQSMSKLGSKTGMSSANQSGMGGSSVQSAGGSAASPRLGQEPHIGQILGGKHHKDDKDKKKKKKKDKKVKKDKSIVEGPNRLGSTSAKDPQSKLMGGGNPWKMEEVSKTKMDLKINDRKHKKKTKKKNSISTEVPEKVVDEKVSKPKSKVSSRASSRASSPVPVPELVSATGATVRVDSRIGKAKKDQITHSRLRSSSLPQRVLATEGKVGGGIVGGMSTTELSSTGSGLGGGSKSGMGSGSGIGGSGSGIGGSGTGTGGFNDDDQPADKPVKTGCRVCQLCPFDNIKKFPGFFSDIHGKWSPENSFLPKKKKGGAPAEDPFANLPEEKSGGSGVLGKLSSSLSSMGKSMSKSLSSLSQKSGIGGKKSKSGMGE